MTASRATARPANTHRAIVRIRGAMNQTVYGTKPESVRRRALKLLHEHPPGFASLYPHSVTMQERRDDEWANIETIPYAP